MKRRHVRVTLEGERHELGRIAEQLGRSSPDPRTTDRAAFAELERRVELLTVELARMSHALGQLVKPSPEDGEPQPDDPGPFFDVLGGTHTTREGAVAVNERVGLDRDAEELGGGS